MSDILAELKQWLEQLIEERPHREARGELPIIEIDLLNRAINEIEELRAEKLRSQRW
jgi:hypothetical protein